ncbi:hypothetical protein LP419_05500 [Massilia sp. H-1]|nr:hypothetical protein LP419_05500 [Massilia sp. H-1]
MKQRYPRLHRHLAARLDPEEALGLHLTVGLLLMAAAAWVFGLIARCRGRGRHYPHRPAAGRLVPPVRRQPLDPGRARLPTGITRSGSASWRPCWPPGGCLHACATGCWPSSLPCRAA